MRRPRLQAQLQGPYPLRPRGMQLRPRQVPRRGAGALRLGAGRVSLVYDLVEEFRQTVVDRTVFGLLNKGVEFKVGDDGLLVEKTRKLLAEKVLERLNEGEERYEGKRHKLRTIIQSQARHIATFVRGERPAYKPFVARW